MMTGDQSNHYFRKCSHPWGLSSCPTSLGFIRKIFRLRVMCPICVIGTPAMRDGIRLPRRRGEKQFVVFSAVQRKLQIDFARGLAHAGARDGLRLQLGTHAAFLADMGQIGREAVAGIDHRGGQSLSRAECGQARFAARERNAGDSPADSACASASSASARRRPPNRPVLPLT